MAVEQENAKETLLGVLSYIDSPFKLGVVVLLMFLGFFGYFVYQNQEVMIGAYLKNKDAQIKAINTQLLDAISELRKRSSRAESAANGACGTGATLSSEDAEFLVREASRADEIRVGLDACYKQYDAIK